MGDLLKSVTVAGGLRPLKFFLAVLLFSGLVLVSSTAWRQNEPAIEPWQWSRAETGLPREAITLAVAAHPDDPDRLWAAYYQSGGVLTSRDGGQSWVEAAKGLAGNPVFDLLVTRSAGTGTETTKVWAATRGGLFWRAEAGATWEPLDWLSLRAGLDIRVDDASIDLISLSFAATLSGVGCRCVGSFLG